MDNSRKYNKRRKSVTEFRSSYSDNKKYFISTDKRSRGMSVLKYTIIAVVLVLVALAGFILTDALLEISEAPYIAEQTTTAPDYTEIDDKYFEGGTVPADKVPDNGGEDIME
ncbi:MAG: hypothetical protein IJT03_03835 [Clostridia bacterium]|nr:hypothetical protein [Clostridia bacterium]